MKYLGRSWRVLDIESTSHFPLTLGENYFEECGDNGTRLITKNEVADVDPIPIADDILTRNGIGLLEVGDNGPSTPPKYRNRYEKWFIHTKWKDTYLWYDRKTKKWHLANMNAAQFEYVHEFQHALRMAGMEKEIEMEGGAK